MDRESVQRVLRDRRKVQQARACYPCQQRKVKCDKSQPCRTCQKRGHPEICTFDFPSGEAAPRQHRHSHLSRETQIEREDLESPAHRRGGQGANVSSSGHDSVPAILSSQVLTSHDEPLAREARAVLGLQNTLTSYLFTESSTSADNADSLVAIIPQRREVIKFYQQYRTHVASFNPILIDSDRFELDLSSYLKAETACELKDRQKLAEGQWSTRKGISFIALLLSILASGAHFSDDAESARKTHAFAKRSFQGLRLANFLFQPSATDIETLLILGNTLQNIGQSDAAWVILGTTARLAQTLGMLSQGSRVEMTTDAQLLRSRVVWQDTLLSMCHDRPPAIYSYIWTSQLQPAAVNSLSFVEVMNRLCYICIEFMQRKALEVWENKSSTDLLRDVDTLYTSALEHLRDADACKDLSQLLEHYALKMHVSFFITYVCRSAIRNSTRPNRRSACDELRLRAKESLIQVCEAFLEFQTLSIVPRRTWSMIHEALSAVLLLYAWDETRNDPDCRQIQEQVVDVFITDIVDTASNDVSGSKEVEWLSPQHIRTLSGLKEALGRKETLRASSSQPVPSIPTSSSANPYINDSSMPSADPYLHFPFPSGHIPLDLNLGNIDMDGLSPLDYLNYYMNGPTTNFSNPGFSFP